MLPSSKNEFLLMISIKFLQYEKQRLKDATKEIDTTYYQSKNSGKQPDALAKRKHQMTYLAFQVHIV